MLPPLLPVSSPDGWIDKGKKKKKAWVFSGSSDLVSVTTLPLPKCENTAELEMKAMENSRQRNPEW